MTDGTLCRIKDLRRGDRVELEDGVGVILLVEKIPVIDTSKGAGGAYSVRWKDDAGEIGDVIEAGNNEIKVLGNG